jgi:DNA-directed RNA polymerase specialized sigma24 family protein
VALWLLEAGLSPAEVADRVHVARGTVTRWARLAGYRVPGGRHDPALIERARSLRGLGWTAAEVARGLGVPLPTVRAWLPPDRGLPGLRPGRRKL